MNSDYSYLVYWMALSQLPRWGSKKINALVEKISGTGLSLKDFFAQTKVEMKSDFGLAESDIRDLEAAKHELDKYQIMVEQMLPLGIKFLNFQDQQYPPLLKKNLDQLAFPPLVFTVGNINLFREPSTAVVGSRDASPVSLDFTRNVTVACAGRGMVIVSGFAKGVDRMALDIAMECNAKSIVVLPQGILTCPSAIKEYSDWIENGKILLVSTFHPKAPWSVGLAMARNVTVYALAEDIYVAQSDSKGGTWEGVQDGLRRGRKIFVRKPGPKEKVANEKLIKKGAIPVDMHGNVVGDGYSEARQQQMDFFS